MTTIITTSIGSGWQSILHEKEFDSVAWLNIICEVFVLLAGQKSCKHMAKESVIPESNCLNFLHYFWAEGNLDHGEIRSKKSNLENTTIDCFVLWNRYLSAVPRAMEAPCWKWTKAMPFRWVSWLEIYQMGNHCQVPTIHPIGIMVRVLAGSTKENWQTKHQRLQDITNTL